MPFSWYTRLPFLDQVQTFSPWFHFKLEFFLWTAMRFSVFSLSLPFWSLGFFFHVSWVGLKLFTHFMTLGKTSAFSVFIPECFRLSVFHIFFETNNKQALFSFYQVDVQVSRVGSALHHVYMPLEGSNPALARHLQPVLILEPHTGLLHPQLVSRELCK